MDVRLEIIHAVHRLCRLLNTGRICANNCNSRASVAKQEEFFLLFLIKKVSNLSCAQTELTLCFQFFQNRDFCFFY